MKLLATFTFLFSTASMAQTVQDVTYSYTTSTSPAPIAIENAGTVNFAQTVVGTSNTVTFSIRNGRNTEVVLNALTFSGTAFSVAGAPTSYPLTIRAGATLSFQISFSPLALARSQGTLRLTYADNQAAFGLDGEAVTSLQGFSFSYIVNPGGNQTAAPANSTIEFNPAAVGASSTVTFIIRNVRTGAAATNSLTVSGVSVTGDGFVTSGLPLFPATVAPSNEIRFTMTFAPTSAASFTGGLRVNLLDSQIALNLSGQGLASTFTYEVLLDSDVIPVSPEGTIRLPQAVLNTGRTSTTIRIRNTGTASGRVTSIVFTTSTTSFALIELPVLPSTLAPGDATTFTIVFTPREVGENTVRLRVDNAFFNIVGSGLGSKLTISVDTGAGSTIVANNAVLAIPNTVVGDKRTIPVVVQNTGNQPATVNALSTSGISYTIATLPPLPTRLEPGDTLSFNVVFSPTAIGTINGALQVEDQSITLRGVGTAPPALPTVTIDVVDQLQAQQQPTVAVKLNSPYPYDLTGVLTLAFTSDSFVDDASIQYASGGRSITFRIPANTTQAVFGNPGAQQVLFQVGTIAGRIQFTSTFAVATVDLTPSGTAPTKTAIIAASEPVIRSVTLGARTTTSIEILVSGYSNTRELSQMRFQFTGTAGSNVTTPTITTNVQSAFDGWYQGTGSRTFGSQFTASIRFDISGNPNALQSVTVVAINNQGTSATRSIDVR